MGYLLKYQTQVSDFLSYLLSGAAIFALHHCAFHICPMVHRLEISIRSKNSEGGSKGKG